MSKYTGITIGPIYETMGLTSSPAGLWGGSYLFSWIARKLIEQLLAAGISKERFVVPWFAEGSKGITLKTDKDDAICEEMRRIGVGMFHDRIIFCSEDMENALQLVQTARQSVLDELGNYLQSRQWLNDYLRVYAVELDVPQSDSPLIYMGKLLSTIELEPHFPSQEKDNPLLSMLRDKGSNRSIKESFLCSELGDRWMLLEDGSKIRDLPTLAAVSGIKDKKYSQYYAVLQSDGDSMSKLLENLKGDEQIRAFSRQCLIFCAKAAKLVKDFGGMPIYAGGDDLLALLPVVGIDGSTLLCLVERLRSLFNETFCEAQRMHDGKPTISIGVSVQYVKEPLYEALECARKMLGEAKCQTEKNACCLHLQKHSGQSIKLVLSRMEQNARQGNQLLTLLDVLCRKDNGEELLSNAGYQIELFQKLFCGSVFAPNRPAMLKNLFDNLFDNDGQKDYRAYLEKLCTLANRIFASTELPAVGKEDAEKQAVVQLQSAVRFLHFMNEKKEAE